MAQALFCQDNKLTQKELMIAPASDQYFQRAAVASGITGIELLLDNLQHKPEPITADNLIPILSLMVSTLKLIAHESNPLPGKTPGPMDPTPPPLTSQSMGGQVQPPSRDQDAMP